MLFIVMISLLNIVNCMVIIYNFDASVGNQDAWIINNGIGSVFTTCNSQNIFGGANSFGVDTSITNIFENLDPHYEIQIEIEFWRIDRWSFDSLKIAVDDDVQFQKSYRQLGSSPDYCGAGGFDDQYELLTLKFVHKRKTAWIYIYVTYNIDFNQSWGIRTFKLSIERCPFGCDICSGNDYPQCLRWHYLESFFFQRLLVGLEQWDGEGFSISQLNQLQCANCDYKQGLKFQREVGLNKHLDLSIRLMKQDVNDIKVYSGGVLNSIIYYQKRFVEFEIGGKNQAISKLSLESMQQEMIIRDIELYYAESENYDTLPFHPGCNQFIGEQCIQCEDGWIYIELELKCQSNCGDRVIQYQEECDDGNLTPFDGCFECKFQCEENCLQCSFGICIMCNQEFELNHLNICLPICGDSIVIPYFNESCDDGNIIQYDGCFNCNFECQELCLTCIHELCLQCRLGYILNNGLCLPYCGDGIVIQDEECDDGNLVPFDGCFECNYQCVESCNICFQGQCILQCENGYQFDIDKCLSICGDNTITVEEECDDGNIIPFDGCHQCKYSCPLNCQICQLGVCDQCYDQYELTESNQCQLINLNNDQQCNDQNQSPNDGCYNLQIESNFVCQTISSYSECTYSKYPQIIIKYLLIEQNIQYVKISFNQKVKTISNQLLSQTMKTQILNVSQNMQNLRLQILNDSGPQIAYVDYILAVEILQLLEEKPILEIQLNQLIVNINNVAVIPNSYYLKLQTPTYLNEMQTQHAQILQQITKFLIYSLGALGLMSMLLGSSSIFFDILNVLQYYQYLRYINLQFPENLMIYFQISDLISIQPLLDIVHFQDLLNLLQINQGFQQSYEKFDFYLLNADLFQSIQVQIFQLLITSLLLILPLNYFKKLIYLKIFTQQFYDLISWVFQYNQKLATKCCQAIYFMAKKFVFLEDLLSYKGFRKILIYNQWDLMFKILLFLQSCNTMKIRDFTQIILSSFIVVAYLQIIIHSFNRSQSKKERILNLLFQKRYENFNLIRIVYFFIILIFCQKQQIIQIMLISNSSILSLFLIFYYRVTFKKTDLIVKFFVEACVFTFTLTSLVYIQDISQQIGEELRIIFGWFHIFTLSIGLIFQFIIIIYEKVKNSYSLSELSNKQKINSHMILEETKKRIVLQQL